MSRKRWGLGTAGLLVLCACAGGGSPSVRGSLPSFDAAALLDVAAADAIRAIDTPRFENPGDAAWLDADDPVQVLELGGIVRAYPLAILLAHQVVNDTVAGEPVAVTFSPLCGSAIALRRSAADKELTLSTAGKVYRACMVLVDRETTTLWSQFDGRAISGELVGTALEALPSHRSTVAVFRARHPTGRVLAPPGTGTYDDAPLAAYERGSGPGLALMPRDLDARLPAMARVVGVVMGGEARAYPHEVLERAARIDDTVGGTEIQVRWDEAADAALVLAAGADIHHVDAFWFAWSSYHPQTSIWTDG